VDLRAALHTAAERLGGESQIPSLDGATEWLNSPRLTMDDLRGKVVLFQFGTYTCINWIRTLPYIRAWADRYGDQGLVVIGLQTPEFSFEHDVDNVRQALKAMRVAYPVAVDNDYAIWDAFDNHYWPALYVIDADGQMRHHHFGEGGYGQTEAKIQELLTASGAGDVAREPASVEPGGVEEAADWDTLRSPENYLGYERTENFASTGGAKLDEPLVYAAPSRLRLNEWGLSGNWTLEAEACLANEPGARILYRFHARDLHLVMRPAGRGASVRIRVLVDGQPPGASHGLDVDENGEGTVSEQRLYQLVRQPGPVEDRDFELAFLDPGARGYVFTFG
jgi:Thioredoxin like C-terminal domain/AhpC/TSA family